ncbi:MAG: hypothetical protein HWE39_05675 [Oceanospirillaceae bacterium]|nr:hypothetical protein [Oceanospirillaceae bacterium]
MQGLASFLGWGIVLWKKERSQKDVIAMKTVSLDEMWKNLSPERQAKITVRAAELEAEHLSRAEQKKAEKLDQKDSGKPGR